MSWNSLQTRLTRMQARLRHRGPDDDGLLFDEVSGVGFAHTRLAILDLSPAGHQPMQVDGGRYTIVFNGEIYNFADLRAELHAEGVAFRSASDTEVILESYRHYGEDCVRRFVGMFALAIWDRDEKSCFLARGPMGIKPLYVWRRGDQLAFASEIRALLAADLDVPRLCPRALHGYLLYGAVQDPLTLVDGVEAIPAGHTLVWKNGDWRLRKFYEFKCGGDPSVDIDAASVTRDALEASVRRHFVSDVPVSIFLSGGIDSTAVVAVARRCGFDELRTFSISFDDPKFDEGSAAARTARHFSTIHADWRMTASDARALFPRFLTALDQPSIDGFNTYCVSKLAHDHGAKVVLSGQGGDELFGGYPSFQSVPKMVRWHQRLAPVGAATRWVGSMAERYAQGSRWRRAGVFLQTGGGVAAAYWTKRGIFTPREANRIAATYLGAPDIRCDDDSFEDNLPLLPCLEDQVSYLESTRYMQNQLLRDSDVMSMAWGLELRVPLVDQCLAEAVCRIPAEHRLARGKRLIVEAVPEIPPWVAEGPKRGFTFPLETWLSGELSDLVADVVRRCPVRLDTWYRRWSILTLEHFLTTNRIAGQLAV